jgi:hypothetical protein
MTALGVDSTFSSEMWIDPRDPFHRRLAQDRWPSMESRVGLVCHDERIEMHRRGAAGATGPGTRARRRAFR